MDSSPFQQILAWGQGPSQAWATFVQDWAQLHGGASVWGVAVSGGSDSLALTLLLGALARQQGAQLRAVTVDHGLRAESAQEARQVGAWLAHYGIGHEILTWSPPQDLKRIQEQARAARYTLLEAWAWHHRVPVVALGHTWEDQVETVHMRSLRHAGPVGSAGMSARSAARFTTFARPLLRLKRLDLQDFLKFMDQPWISDPSNESTAYERIRLRHQGLNCTEEDLRMRAVTRAQYEKTVNDQVRALLKKPL